MAHRFQYTVISILSAVLQKCGLRCTRKFGKMLGLLLMLQTKRRMITYDNISKAYPGHSDEWKGALVRGAYVNLGITFAEMLYSKALSADDLINQVTFSGLDVVAERARNGLPSILLSGHFGNWEYLAMAAGVCLHKPLTIVVHPQHNAYLDAELNTIRTRFGNIVVPMHKAARTLVRTIQEGGIVAFLADQHASADHDPQIEFFGRPTPTYGAPAALALKFNVPMFLGTAVRHDTGKYSVNVQPVPSADLSDNPESVIELTHRHVAMLESEIRANPHLWSWQHRRWRM